MRSNKFILTLLFFCFSIGILTAQKKNNDNPYFFIQITDPQFGMHEENARFEKETELYEKAVAQINRLKPDFVVITGDFVHDPNDENQINEFKKITGKIASDIPVYLIPGNHDVGQVPDYQSLKKYKANYGADKFAFNHKGSRFIGFNTSLVKAEITKLEAKQFKWLKQELKKGKKANHVIVFGHYPFFIQSFDEPEKYSNIKLEYRKKYLSLFKENNVHAIFSGHLHNNAQAKYEDIWLITTSAVGKPLGNAPSGLRIVKIYKDKFEHDYFGLDEVPDKVVFD